MRKIKIGILREERVPSDRRVALLPKQCLYVIEKYGVEIVVQPSDVRCFSNKEYLSTGIQLQENLSDCDILVGIKEVPVHLLIPEKTYLIFSHTIKKQPHNKKLLQSVLQQNIRLIDYEGLTNTSGERVIAFGKYAGIVGAYNALLMYGRRFQLFHLKRALECSDEQTLKSELKKVYLPPIKIALTGGGRVAEGVIEILENANIKKVSPELFISKKFDFPAYTQLHSSDYHIHKERQIFARDDFFKNPEHYNSDFEKFYPHIDLLIASAYWHPKAPKLFTLSQMQNNNFKIKVIADITCDIDGSIPSTIRPSTIDNPAYDFNRFTGLLEPAFSDEKNITVMAVDNLPGEIPRIASEGFGNQLIENVLPHLLGNRFDGLIKTGIVAEYGKLTDKFNYLSDYVYDI